jgi:hypothetical protein
MRSRSDYVVSIAADSKLRKSGSQMGMILAEAGVD